MTVESINLRVLTCPHDGTIIPETRSNGDGTYECPHCGDCFEAHKVIV